MDGAAYDFIIIPIVMLPLLAGWLGMMFWADSHPRTSPRPASVTYEPDAVTGPVNVPLQAKAQPPLGAGEGSPQPIG